MTRPICLLGEIILLLSLGASVYSRRGLVARLENAALNKPTLQGPNTHRYLDHFYKSSFAVDGNPSSLFPDCAGVDTADIMWWIVDLTRSRKIHAVRILPRQDSSYSLENFTIDMFDDDPRLTSGFPRNFGQICASQIDKIGPGKWTGLSCTAIMKKRFVRIVKHGNSHMALCEVEILAEELDESTGQAYKIKPKTAATVDAKTYVGQFPTAMYCAVALFDDNEPNGFQFDTETRQCFVFQTSPLRGDAGVESSATYDTYTVL
ncbi:fucolectin-like [Elysia marginata]|uniref:Fucolectin-like n=1 Tax=Elysia marginata TaxID=1093978 RepID=A0AAV4HI77_9GAST|nr:fucolectin-like [Elysia marginata]